MRSVITATFSVFGLILTISIVWLWIEYRHMLEALLQTANCIEYRHIYVITATIKYLESSGLLTNNVFHTITGF
jgi:hypothetical protein